MAPRATDSFDMFSARAGRTTDSSDASSDRAGRAVGLFGAFSGRGEEADLFNAFSDGVLRVTDMSGAFLVRSSG